MFNYQEISNKLTRNLPERTKDVISRRFGLNNNKTESLESIGVDYGITRERVRQIESDGMLKIKNFAEKYQPVFTKLEEKINDFGGVKKEDLYISSLGEEEDSNHIIFLLTLSNSFVKFSKNKNFHSFWASKSEDFNFAQNTLNHIKQVLEQKKEPLKIKDCSTIIPNIPISKIKSYLEISKEIHIMSDEVFGLNDWPEVNPKNIKNKAYIIFKKQKKPLHFREVSSLMGDSVLSQTVHNELIKDDRFVLVGRGIYALREWGYTPGEVKDVISKILLESGRPLSRKEIIEKVLEKRLVKESTIIQNLGNKKYFKKTTEGYFLINKDKKY
jgi:hypothetical protein